MNNKQKQVLEKIEIFRNEVSTSKEKTLKALQEAGICNSKGKLNLQYRMGE